MKTEFKISRKQILKLVHGSSIDNLEKWFPEVFKVELEVGKVYKSTYHKKVIVKPNYIDSEGVLYGYGFNTDGNFYKQDFVNTIPSRCLCNNEAAKKLVEATTEEWESALIEEAKRRGYKNGNYECLSNFGSDVVDISKYSFVDGWLYQGDEIGDCNRIFKDGIWAEIIKKISKEEAEKQLGCKII
jgi:hypothetical protein